MSFKNELEKFTPIFPPALTVQQEREYCGNADQDHVLGQIPASSQSICDLGIGA